jgi:hypothetical protein
VREVSESVVFLFFAFCHVFRAMVSVLVFVFVLFFLAGIPAMADGTHRDASTGLPAISKDKYIGFHSVIADGAFVLRGYDTQ